jgi:hypothetical protein
MKKESRTIYPSSLFFTILSTSSVREWRSMKRKNLSRFSRDCSVDCVKTNNGFHAPSIPLLQAVQAVVIIYGVSTL